MAWEWSHTPEAYENARAQLAALDRTTLETIYAEWKCNPRGNFHPRWEARVHALCLRRYERALSAARYLSSDTLVDRIWEWMERLATCTNGGFEAWCCPYGCGCHLVPFDPVDSDDSE